MTSWTSDLSHNSYTTSLTIFIVLEMVHSDTIIDIKSLLGHYDLHSQLTVIAMSLAIF